ncbi:hypothetical protein V1517DRAFT_64563 [Lipomyces orientalis]|uniref:Uncharacterized protein n=1 Tax=Lipomyces orientalis TaxID=1233043 RepID=A0ACC3TSY4_9ASCO
MACLRQFRPYVSWPRHFTLVIKRNLINGAKYHHSLDTFLQYAKQQGLPVNTTYFVGTVYEYVVLESLTRSARMRLEHSGGTGDNGVDLRGTMSTYESEKKIPVIIQCKYEQKKPGARFFRELEGSLVNASPETLAVLAAPLPATAAGKRILTSSDKAMAFCLVLGYEEGGVMTQMIWNSAAEKLLGGLRIARVYREVKAEGEMITVQSIALIDTKLSAC